MIDLRRGDFREVLANEQWVVAEKKTDGRKKALDLLGKVAQHFQRGEET